jgi:hypothetical protein
MSIDNEPTTLDGHKLQAGDMMMGKQNGNRVKFDVESAQDIDRKIQNEMYDQPALNKWGVFYCE